MTIRIRRLVLVAASLAALGMPARAHGGWSIGVRLGLPIYIGGWGPYYGYYPYPPVYVAPAPVYVPAPVAVQPAAVAPAASAVQPACQSAAPPPAYQTAAPPTIARAVAQEASDTEVEHHLQMLSDPDERTRAASVMELGRLRAPRAVDPLAATLAGDRSPAVREAAARALALIGSRQALPALQQAARADPDHDVRHSAEFAIEVVQTGR